jgi:hypothetical protein
MNWICDLSLEQLLCEGPCMVAAAARCSWPTLSLNWLARLQVSEDVIYCFLLPSVSVIYSTFLDSFCTLLKSWPVLWIRRRDPDSGGQKLPTKIEKSYIILFFAGCSLLRVEGFSCSLGLTLRRPRDNKIAIFDQRKIYKKFQLYFFSSIFGHQN